MRLTFGLLAAASFAMLGSHSCAQAAPFATPSSIYGEDSRTDLYAVSDAQTLRLAESSLALVWRENLSPAPEVDTDAVRLTADTFAKEERLCPGERFANQPSGAFCSAFLVGADVILTAGHCVESSQDCQDTAFVFGFSYPTPQSDPSILRRKNVYGCKELLYRKQKNRGADFAIVRLDRPVTDRAPLRLARNAQSGVGEALQVIGHPSGLPTKVATGVVRDASPKGYFLSNLDSYGGNSGSAVLNARSGEVEGILVRGEQDFTYDSKLHCYRSTVFEENEGPGEDATKINAVIPHLPAL